MENQNNKGLKILVCVLCVLVLAMGGYIVYDKINDKKVDNENTNTDVEINQTNTTSTEITKSKTLQDVYNDSDTDLVKAQKIAKEVMNAVNNKDYDFLEKYVSEGEVERIKKYDVHNYIIDIEDYRTIDEFNEYAFDEKYDTNIPEDQESELGALLIVAFEDNGKISIDMFCTGV